jgi:nitrate/nitrite transporter NarK
MKSKYFEHIVVYLSVFVVCVLIGVLTRLIVIGAGVDEFTANTIFWVVTAFGMIGITGYFFYGFLPPVFNPRQQFIFKKVEFLC